MPLKRSLLPCQAIPCSPKENMESDFYHPNARKGMKTVSTDAIQVSSHLKTARVSLPLRQSYS